MPYVTRNEAGEVNGIFANPQDFTTEYLPDDDAAVAAFLAPVAEVIAEQGAEGAVSVGTPSIQDQIDALAARIAVLEAKAG